MEWLKDLSVLADLPLTAILLVAVIILWRENRRLSDKIILITEANLHMSTDNHERLKRVEGETTGNVYPTLPKRPDTFT